MLTLYRHQQLALAYLRIHSNFALFMEQGCGKTIPCLCRILELAKSNLIRNALIIAPKATTGAWYRDIEKFESDAQQVLIKTISVINYDAVWRKTPLDKTWKNSSKYNKSNTGTYDKVWDLIILDESHKIKNRTSIQSKMALRLAVNAKYRYILTGTPISNGSLEDIWSQFTFLDPVVTSRGAIVSRIFNGSYANFISKYALLNQWYQPYKYLHVNEIQEIINNHSYRVTKAECLDLPEQLQDEFYTVELLEPKLYKELAKDSVVVNLEFVASNSLAKMSKLRQVCSGFIIASTLQKNGLYEDTLHKLNCEKIKVLDELLDGWSSKLVIFAEFKYSISSISDLLSKRKIKHLILDGNQKDKTIWRRFQDDPTVQIIICNYKSANAGIDLYAASTTIFYEPTLSATILDQSKARTHRAGQLNKCSYIHFVTKKTIEEKIVNALLKYIDFNEKMFENYLLEFNKENLTYKNR
jgi:SNF2 family DNA or RNA helicase